ncbi:MAG: hypothetical protein RLZZ514_1283 [Actinomycetota bacterium]|jgi:hypothetical protein
MDSPQNIKEKRLEELVFVFCEERLVWSPLEDGEKEPSYTRRVLYPQFKKFVDDLGDKQVSLASDGTQNRPTPVLIGHGQKFFPDMSISVFGGRSIAFEVKFLGDQSFSGSLATAVGQALVYSTCGYSYAHALLVGSAGSKAIFDDDKVRLNAGLGQVGVTIHFLSN